jgi:hypothetical protein
VIIPIPSLQQRTVLFELAQNFSSAISLPLVRSLKTEWRDAKRGEPSWNFVCNPSKDLEGKDLILLDLASDQEWLRQALRQIWLSFPRSVQIFSIFETPLE